MSSTKTIRQTATHAKASKKAVVVSAKPGRAPRAVAPKAEASTAPWPESATAPVKAKHKLVRDSFTIPKAEYMVLEGLKDRAAKLTRPIKKRELLRAGISALRKMTDRAFLAALNDVSSLKTGRPKALEAAEVRPRTDK